MNGWVVKGVSAFMGAVLLAYIAYIGTALESHADRPGHDDAIKQIARLENVTDDLKEIKEELKEMRRVRRQLSHEVSRLRGYLGVRNGTQW